MDRAFLINQSQTAQVRIFTEELLGDGCFHSRKEIMRYVELKRQQYSLPEFRSGHLAGGVQQATVNCEKLGRGNFRKRIQPQNDSQETEFLSGSQSAIQIINDAISQLSVLARKIDFLDANEEQVRELEKLKEGVQRLKDVKRIWETE